MLEKLDKSQKNRSLLDLVCNDQEFKRVKVLISQQLLDLSCELSKERDALQEVYHDFCQETEQVNDSLSLLSKRIFVLLFGRGTIWEIWRRDSEFKTF